ncbi:MAG: carboxylesterase/lipase family protein [Clostridiales bacterium]|nr:carboxylesterase/lipase family protein [Clostridiales bacterium]
MKKLLSLVLSLAMLLSCFTAIAVADEAVMPAIVTISSGEIMGYNDNGLYAFKGIPYGKAERFEEATKPDAWEGIVNCLTLGEVCPQDRTLSDGFHVNDAEWITPAGNDMVGSEKDCLNLNVWTSSMDTTAKKPVVVFMHGGGLHHGSSNELAVYDGANFAATTDCIFVSVNMRLNYLGFLDVSAYGDETYKNSGNLGLTDMVLALEWVQDNIETFGGDKTNVTLYGQSGGGTKVAALACLPAAEGLFDRVAIVSGDATYETAADQRAATADLVEYLGLTEQDDVIAALKALSFEELYHAGKAAGVYEYVQVDGDYFPSPWYDTETGKMNELAAKREYLISSAFSEFSFSGQKFVLDERFYGAPDMSYFRPNMTDEAKAEAITAAFGDKEEAVLAAFAEAFPSHEPLDAIFYCDRTWTMDEFVVPCITNDVKVYSTVIGYNLPLMGGITMWHSGDIGFWFNSMDRIPYQIKGDEDNAHAVASAVSSALAAFAATGDPSTETLKWSPYTAEDPVTMVFDTQSYEKTNLDTELITLLNEINPY